MTNVMKTKRLWYWVFSWTFSPYSFLSVPHLHFLSFLSPLLETRLWGRSSSYTSKGEIMLVSSGWVKNSAFLTRCYTLMDASINLCQLLLRLSGHFSHTKEEISSGHNLLSVHVQFSERKRLFLITTTKKISHTLIWKYNFLCILNSLSAKRYNEHSTGLVCALACQWLSETEPKSMAINKAEINGVSSDARARRTT